MAERHEMEERPVIDWPLTTTTFPPDPIIDPVPWWWLVDILREREIINVYKVNLRYRRDVLQAQIRYQNEIMEILDEVFKNK